MSYAALRNKKTWLDMSYPNSICLEIFNFLSETYNDVPVNKGEGVVRNLTAANLRV